MGIFVTINLAQFPTLKLYLLHGAILKKMNLLPVIKHLNALSFLTVQCTSEQNIAPCSLVEKAIDGTAGNS